MKEYIGIEIGGTKQQAASFNERGETLRVFSERVKLTRGAPDILDWLDTVVPELITERTVAIARKYGKKSERWFMGYYRQPKDWSQVAKWVDIAEAAGVDRIAAWTYRGGYGTVVGAPDALKLWDTIGENYRRVLGK